MQQRIVGRIRCKIAGLTELKQIGCKYSAGRDIFAEQRKTFRQKNEPADHVGDGQHRDQRRKYPAHPAGIETEPRKGAFARLCEDDAGNQEAGYHKKNIDPDKSAGNPLRVISNHQQNRNRTQAVDVSPIRRSR